MSKEVTRNFFKNFVVLIFSTHHVILFHLVQECHVDSTCLRINQFSGDFLRLSSCPRSKLPLWQLRLFVPRCLCILINLSTSFNCLLKLLFACWIFHLSHQKLLFFFWMSPIPFIILLTFGFSENSSTILSNFSSFFWNLLLHVNVYYAIKITAIHLNVYNKWSAFINSVSNLPFSLNWFLTRILLLFVYEKRVFPMV